MKGFSLLLICTLFLGSLSAQIKRTVHLKDGSILKGEIIEDNEYFIKIVIETGDTLQVGYKNIMDKEQTIQVRPDRSPPTYKEEGYFGSVGINYLITDMDAYRIQGLFGKRLNSRWHVGLNVGYNYKQDVLGQIFIEPRYLDFGPYARYYLTQGRPRLFTSVSLGYMLSTNNEIYPDFIRRYDSDVRADVQLGLHLANRHGFNAIFQAGLSFESIGGEQSYFQPGVGQISTIFNKQYYTPIIGVMFEF